MGQQYGRPQLEEDATTAVVCPPRTSPRTITLPSVLSLHTLLHFFKPYSIGIVKILILNGISI